MEMTDDILSHKTESFWRSLAKLIAWHYWDWRWNRHYRKGGR
jgi:hypothetical protein